MPAGHVVLRFCCLLWRGASLTLIDRVRLIIFKANGPNAKKNCPDWTALRLQAMRAERVLRYWGSAFDSKTEEIEYQGHGWAAGANKPEAKLTSGNCCVQLSPYALLNQDGKVKMLTCGCTGGVSKTPLCNSNSCGCHKRGTKCVPMHCGCDGKCYKNRADLKEKIEKQQAEAAAARAKADAEKATADAERAASVAAAAAAAGTSSNHGPQGGGSGLRRSQRRPKRSGILAEALFLFLQ
ncbi:unnamed protein product, partial [Ectocarpus sp. 12 AP-2014]